MKNKVLVTGATGFQGGAVVRQLITDKYQVKGFALPDEDVKLLNSMGVDVARGSFDDIDSLANAFRGIDAVVLSFPLIFDEPTLLRYAQNVISAWQQSNVSLFVFNTNLPVIEQTTGLAAFDIKLAIEKLFDKHSFPYISLRPTLYMDNLSAPFLLPVIQSQGILPYPIPAEAKIAWLSHGDLAKFISAALLKPELRGNKFYIGGIQRISGEEMAKIISSLAGKQINFISLTPDQFESQLSSTFGPSTAKEIANIYRFVHEHVEHLQAHDLRDKTLIDLPVNLQTFDDWASRIAWT